MEIENNTQTLQETERIEYPWLIFRLAKNYYAISSRLINAIMDLPAEIAPVPNAPNYLRGIFMLRGNVVQMVELRGLMGLRTQHEEHLDFCSMIDMRKQDHLKWVIELERCAKSDEPFKLATDPHKCAFGKWYYQFASGTHSISFHMNKIEEPHRLLHESAIELSTCSQECDKCVRDECLKSIFTRLDEELVPKIVGLLDQSKKVFEENIREMLIVLEGDGHQMGLVVDEVIAVEQLSMSYDNQNLENFEKSAFITGVCNSQVISANLLVLDDDALVHALGDTSIPEEILA